MNPSRISHLPTASRYATDRTLRLRALGLWVCVLALAAGVCGAGCDGEGEASYGHPDATDQTGGADSTPTDVTSDVGTADTAHGGVLPPTGWSSTPPSMRSDVEVCAAWLSTRSTATLQHDPTDGCVAGAMTIEARTEAMYRLNFYRWLVGLEPAWEATQHLAGLQQCAFYFASNTLPVSHTPDPGQPCFSEQVSELAGISNLASSVSSAQHAIDTFVQDAPHRALILGPGLTETAIGYFEGVACQLVFGENWRWEFPIHRTIAFPAPGPNPQAPSRVFSIQPGTGHTFDDQTTITVTQNGSPITASVTLGETSYGTDLLVATLDVAPSVGDVLRVTVSGIAAASERVQESFPVRFVACE